MTNKKSPKERFLKTFFGCFFACLAFLSSFLTPALVYADEEDYSETIIETEDGIFEDETSEDETSEDEASDSETSDKESEDGASEDETSEDETSCTKQLGAIGWIVCPTTGKLAEATDWIYDKIEQILIINPLSFEDGSPVYEIWKVARDLTNIVFIIFLLIVVISQITGLGINNYGVKKALPKLLVAAVLVNLSFLICSLGIEISNIFGKGIRGIFSAVEETAISNMTVTDGASSVTGLAVSGGIATLVTILAAETGLIWMIIPTILGAFVAVVTGLITIALRQALVILLVMIAPLAIVSNILPNVEQYYSKWKQMLLKMLIFYPSFAVLFGASNLAGFAIIASAENGFWTLLGIAVQIFPLFFAWKLMQMSGTILGGINNALRGIAAKPLAENRAWAESHRALSYQKYLERGKTPSAHLSRYLERRRISRAIETKEIEAANMNYGAAYHATRHYRKNGSISKAGERAYERQARNARYSQIIATDKNNYNRGLSGFSDDYKKNLASMRQNFLRRTNEYSVQIKGGFGNKNLENRLEYLDWKNVEAFDSLKYEAARGGKIEYENAKGFQERSNNAINAHMDLKNKDNKLYQAHEMDASTRLSAEARYDNMLNIMEGKELDVHFASADAAYMFNSQAQIVQGKFQKYFDLTAPTQDVVHRLREFTTLKDSDQHTDQIIAGLRTLNQRGDTDLVRAGLRETLLDVDSETGKITKKVHLGTYASQSIANFCMFDVKDSDPTLRRFGKYINLETAHMFNENDPKKRRVNPEITIDEYISGEYEEYDLDENNQPIILSEENGKPKYKTHIAHPKRDASALLQGTSFKGMERTAISNMTEMIRDASYDTNADGEKIFNMDKFKKNQEKIWNAIMPNIIGDQFTFLSGSEQIKALAKGITGMDGHDFDWKGIFGAKIAESLTDEQKKDYITFLNKRTNTFMGGHVPNQIARTKSDMLDAVMNLFTMSSVAENDESVLNKTELSDDEYKEFVKRYGDTADEKLIHSLKEETLTGFLKMWHKGYQGDTKANLTQHLHAPELYEKYFGAEDRQNAKKRRVTNEDEDGQIPTINDQTGGYDNSQIYQGELTNIYMSDQSGNPHGFYVDAYSYLISRHLNGEARAFDEYYQNNSTATRADLYNFLNNLL